MHIPLREGHYNFCFTQMFFNQKADIAFGLHFQQASLAQPYPEENLKKQDIMSIIMDKTINTNSFHLSKFYTKIDAQWLLSFKPIKYIKIYIIYLHS
jgi:hypothetical protein